MSGAEVLPWWAAIPVAVLLVLGGLMTLIGAFGLARLHSFYQRMHGPAITVTLGAGCILLASMLSFTVAQSRLVIHELLISVFILMTAPVVAMLIMRAGVYRELRNRPETSATVDERPDAGECRSAQACNTSASDLGNTRN